jgi:hypothetical protein
VAAISSPNKRPISSIGIFEVSGRKKYTKSHIEAVSKINRR